MAQGDRDYYLKTLGIDEYLPKDLIADNALPVVEVLEATVNESSIDEKIEPMIEPISAEQLLGSFDISSDPSTAVEQVKTQPVSEIPADPLGGKPDPIVRIELQLALWQPTDALVVCSVIDQSLPDPDQIQLLSNILVAMGQGQVNLPQMELAQWPPYPNAVGGEPEVREFLAMVIQARLEAKNSKMILILGVETARWILTEEQTANISNGQTNVFNEIVGLVIPSLAEMIEDPQSKRKAWNTIRFLSPHKKPHVGDATD